MPDTTPTTAAPFRFIDEDDFCLSARLLPDLNTGRSMSTLSITIEGSDEPQSVHVPVYQLPQILTGIADAARLVLGTTDQQPCMSRSPEGHRCDTEHTDDKGPHSSMEDGQLVTWYDEQPVTAPAGTELAAEEVRDLADELNTELYQARDALAFVEECCVIADREQRPVTTTDVREWLKGARCGRQLATDRAAADQPADRRDRYAAAIWDVDALAAVMAVADTEQAALRAERDDATHDAAKHGGRYNEACATIDRLRAEVERLRTDRARVENVLESEHVLGRSAETYRRLLRVALMADEAQQPETEAATYPPTFPWAALMDTEDLAEFLAEVEHAVATPGATAAEALDAAEKACSTWRVIAEAQHGHNTAPGPQPTPAPTEERRAGDDRCPGFCIPCMTDESHHPAP